MLRTSFEPTTLETSVIADKLSASFRVAYCDGVSIVTRAATITISRGKRAAQVQVLGYDRFVVSLRRNQTFHMHPEPVGHEIMASLVKRMVDVQVEAPAAA